VVTVPQPPPSGTVKMNSRCTPRIEGEQHVVASGVPVHHYSENDPGAEAFAIVLLADSGFA